MSEVVTTLASHSNMLNTCDSFAVQAFFLASKELCGCEILKKTIPTKHSFVQTQTNWLTYMLKGCLLLKTKYKGCQFFFALSFSYCLTSFQGLLLAQTMNHRKPKKTSAPTLNVQLRTNACLTLVCTQPELEFNLLD